MRKSSKSSTGEHSKRHDLLIRERVRDPYKARLKLPEPAVCLQCRDAWKLGRWKWVQQRSCRANEELLQTCHLINNKYSAGVTSRSGNFLSAHREEVMHRIRKTQSVENIEDPLNRIMTIEQQVDPTIVTITDIHLPRSIGQTIYNAYQGQFDFKSDEGGYFINVNWCQDDRD